MAVVTVHFRECIQDLQEYGTDDEYMVSRVLFEIEVEDRVVKGLHVDIKQAAGGNFEADPIEVSPVRGTSYRGPFHYQRFRDEVEAYFRGLVGAVGRQVKMVSGASARFRNVGHTSSKTVRFETDGEEGAW